MTFYRPKTGEKFLIPARLYLDCCINMSLKEKSTWTQNLQSPLDTSEDWNKPQPVKEIVDSVGKEVILDPMVLQTIEIQLGQVTHLCNSLLQTPTKGMRTLSLLPQQAGMNTKPVLLNLYHVASFALKLKCQAQIRQNILQNIFFFSWVTEELSNISRLKTCILLKYTIEAFLVTGNNLHFNLTTFNYIFKDSKLRISIFSGQKFCFIWIEIKSKNDYDFPRNTEMILDSFKKSLLVKHYFPLWL